MGRRGRDLELLVARLEHVLAETPLIVKSPERIRGRLSGSLREVDVTVRIPSSGLFVAFECRDRAGSQDVGWIEQVIQKQEDIHASTMVAVSSSGFTPGARAMAKAKGLLLRRVSEVATADVFEWLNARSVRVVENWRKLGRVEFVVDPGTPDELMPEGRMGTSHSPLFVAPDGSALSAEDVWDRARARGAFDEAYRSLTTGERRRDTFTARYPDPDEHYRVQLGPRAVRVTEIRFIDAEIWSEVSEVPFARFREYIEGDSTLAQTVEAIFEKDERAVLLSLHVRDDDSGDRRVFVTIAPYEAR